MKGDYVHLSLISKKNFILFKELKYNEEWNIGEKSTEILFRDLDFGFCNLALTVGSVILLMAGPTCQT